MSFADHPEWRACSATLRGEGYNHTAGDDFARLREGKRRGMGKARIVRDGDKHSIQYL